MVRIYDNHECQIIKLEMDNHRQYLTSEIEIGLAVFALIFFHPLAQKPTLDKFSIYSNQFFHNFYFSKSSFTVLVPGFGQGV